MEHETSDGSIRVHAFKAYRGGDHTGPLNQTLEAIASDGIEARTRTINGAISTRVEDIRQDDDFWLVDFARLRYEGPGKAPRDAPLADIEVDENDRFAEETALLFHPSSSSCLIQSNHRGLRAGSIARYFSQYRANAADAYEFRIILDEDIDAKLQQQEIQRKLTVAFDPRSMMRRDVQNNMAAEVGLSLGDASGANKVEITLQLKGRRDAGLNDRVRTWTRMFRSRARDGDTSLTKLEATGKQGPGDASEVLDLIKGRLTVDIDGITLGPGRRLDREARYDGLKRAFRGWRERLED